MSSKQCVTIASRVLTIYFLTLACYRFLDIPSAIMALTHAQNAYGDQYFRRIYTESIAHSVLMIALCLSVALMFYRCGPKVMQFLTGDDAVAPVQVEDQATED